MAGRGPAPKPAGKRARRNADPVPSRVIENWQTERKPMPEDLLPDGEMWHPATVRWWQRWLDSPLSETWTEVDWSELEACAVLHHEFMRKRTFTLASEIRLRMQKFGATAEDRARLRIVLADADEKDAKRTVPAGPSSARERRGPLKAV